MSKLSRDKGAAYERLVAKMLAIVWPASARGLKQCRDASEDPDVTGTPFWVECKHQRNVSIQAALKQGEEATDGRPVVVVTRNNRGPDMVTMRLTDWIDLFTGGSGQ